MTRLYARLSKVLLLSIILLGGIFTLLASNDNTGEYSSEPDLGLRISLVSNGSPAIGEEVIIDWEYETPSRLRIQGFRIISLLFDGNLSTRYIGCLPFYSEGSACYDNNYRQARIIYSGPITVIVDAVDDFDQIVSKAIKLRDNTMAFRVFQLEHSNPGFPNYTGVLPSFNQNTNEIKPVIFDKAFGIYENSKASALETGAIDYLQSYPNLNADSSFFAELRPGTNNLFEFVRGKRFPLLQPKFIASNWSNGQVPWGSRYANSLIYAGYIGIQGSIEETKTATGESIDVYIQDITSRVEPFFIQLDMRSEDNTSTIHAADIHVGNQAQQLVFSAYQWDTNVLAQGTAVVFNTTPFGELEGRILTTSGSVKGAVVGIENWRTTSGEILVQPKVALTFDWTNIPMYPDDNMSALLNTYE